MQVFLQDKKQKQGALSTPEFPANIPEGSKWLGGEGYGVWFHISKNKDCAENEYRIRRYSSKGQLHCDRIFKLVSGNNFNYRIDYEFGYISHCEKCTIIQNNKIFIFKYVKTK